MGTDGTMIYPTLKLWIVKPDMQKSIRGKRYTMLVETRTRINCVADAKNCYLEQPSERT